MFTALLPSLKTLSRPSEPHETTNGTPYPSISHFVCVGYHCSTRTKVGAHLPPRGGGGALGQNEAANTLLASTSLPFPSFGTAYLKVLFETRSNAERMSSCDEQPQGSYVRSEQKLDFDATLAHK
jgi:hypothetical protein